MMSRFTAVIKDKQRLLAQFKDGVNEKIKRQTKLIVGEDNITEEELDEVVADPAKY